ncbi:hypothetical protein B0H66DRAFT_356648 [Apodospora peruviana]|uniref:Uncharacterized protein n=1 Tax=Apodospora peruviana TaxID=516989 RepID=A0AAE0HVY8_9PEZI|nr:hypothetical protein B0H66DRAFT_356648 [Apodospora peruviana]
MNKKRTANDVQAWRAQPAAAMSLPHTQQLPQQQQQHQQAPPQNAYTNQWNPHYSAAQYAAQPADMGRREQQQQVPDFRHYGTQPQAVQQAQHPHHQQHYAPPPVQQQQQQQPLAHAPQPQQAPPPQQVTPTPAPAPAPVPTPRSRKRAAPGAGTHAAAHPPQHAPQHAPQHTPAPHPPQQQQQPPQPVQQTPIVPPQVPQLVTVQQQQQQPPAPAPAPPQPAAAPAQPAPADDANSTPMPPPAKKSRTNTPWTPHEEQRLKQMRDAGNSWAEIAKTFPTRTEGSVKKHWYKDMHYAEFAEDEKQALLNAIKEYENNKWKVIGQKVGKPAKACEQFAKEQFPGKEPCHCERMLLPD